MKTKEAVARGKELARFDAFALTLAAAAGEQAIAALRRGNGHEARLHLQYMAAQVLIVDRRGRPDSVEPSRKQPFAGGEHGREAGFGTVLDRASSEGSEKAP